MPTAHTTSSSEGDDGMKGGVENKSAAAVLRIDGVSDANGKLGSAVGRGPNRWLQSRLCRELSAGRAVGEARRVRCAASAAESESLSQRPRSTASNRSDERSSGDWTPATASLQQEGSAARAEGREGSACMRATGSTGSSDSSERPLSSLLSHALCVAAHRTNSHAVTNEKATIPSNWRRGGKCERRAKGEERALRGERLPPVSDDSQTPVAKRQRRRNSRMLLCCRTWLSPNSSANATDTAGEREDRQAH